MNEVHSSLFMISERLDFVVWTTFSQRDSWSLRLHDYAPQFKQLKTLLLNSLPLVSEKISFIKCNLMSEKLPSVFISLKFMWVVNKKAASAASEIENSNRKIKLLPVWKWWFIYVFVGIFE
jgi:hypothetical protein